MAILKNPALLEHQEMLDRESPVPLYHQLYEILRSHIELGVWKPGEMIPPESELKKRYGVSQITVRQSLNILVENGTIYRRRGKGTFVAQPMITSNLTHIVNFAEDMRNRGMEPYTELINSSTAVMSSSTAAFLNAEVGEELAVFKRLRFADGKPLSVEVSCLVHKYVPGILENDFSKRSLSETLAVDYHIVISRAEQTIRAQVAAANTAEYLGIDEDDPILVIERIGYSQHNIPVEFLRITYRGDRYALHCELKGT
jgi:GntR family transcriptional regulator